MAERFPDLPQRMRGLARDFRGFPVPKFVEWINGQPDFRVMSSAHLRKCIRSKACWICGETTGAFKAFVIGPMCAINRVNSEPPSHLECALFAAQHCPFLSQPLAKRNERNMPEHREPAGIMLLRNPGCCCIWVTKDYQLMPLENGVLFRLGEPTTLGFYAHGRDATRAEVTKSVETGFPLLLEVARREGQRAEREAYAQLDRFWKLANNYLPREDAA